MKGSIFINETLIGTANFVVIDEGMGAIGGEFIPEPAYQVYESEIKHLYEAKGIANVDDLNFKICLENGLMLDPEGGIGLTDSAEFEERYVEAAGVDLSLFK